MAIGKQIKHYREKLGWTLERVSELSEVDVGTISALEVRDSSRSKYFQKIAKAFGLTLEQLADESTDHDIVIAEAEPNGAVVTLKAGPTPSAGTWPFLTVTPEQYWRLSEAQRNHVETTALMLIPTTSNNEHASKQSTPATAINAKTA